MGRLPMTRRAAGFFIATAALAVASLSAAGHDFYPYECCSGRDCAPAKVESVPAPALASMLGPGETSSLPSLMRVTTVHGSAMVPANFKVRESPDGRAHACMIDTA